jgi:hypothetical protein
MSPPEYPQFLPFKFVNMQVYASTEWLADGKKKYRRVFEYASLTYLYSELSFYNKRYESQPWVAQISLSCNAMSQDGQVIQQVCNIEFERTIEPGEFMIHVREGWGNTEPGNFWKPGTYAWVAVVNGYCVGQALFYVQDTGPMTADHNPYFEIHSVRTFEGPNELPILTDRRYGSMFDSNKVRYIWGELTFKNLIRDMDWMCDVNFNFFNEARELKGTNTAFMLVPRSLEYVNACSGWGSVSTGTWFEGSFTLEIVFMDRLIAVLPFEIREGKEDDKSILPKLKNLRAVKWLFGNA